MTEPEMRRKAQTIKKAIIRCDTAFSLADNDRDSWNDAARQTNGPHQL
jgi:hypothetical protein